MSARVLTVRQPFAAAILAGLKTIEYRSWPTKYRGTLLIHAAARRPTREDLEEFPELDPAGLVYSAILGAVDLVGCEDIEIEFEWALENPRALAQPWPCSGKLGLWKAPAGLLLPC